MFANSTVAARIPSGFEFLRRPRLLGRPFQAGFAGGWFRHEKPLRFRAGPAGAAPAFMDCGDMSPLSKRRPVGAVQRRIRHPGRTSSASALNPGLNDGIPLGFYRTPLLAPCFFKSPRRN